MPDKPKRRKNNKNKRKNKNNNRNNNVNKNISDVNDASSVNSCDCQDDTLEDSFEKNQTESNINQSRTNDIQNEEINLKSPENVSSDIQSVECETVSKSKVNSEKDHCNSSIIKVPQVQERHSYVVETPDVKKKVKSKLNNSLKSKSVDNDDAPIIVEITEDVNIQPEIDKGLALVDNSNVIITDVESDVEWENMDELHEVTNSLNLTAEAFSVMTIPLEIAQCEQAKSLSPEDEKSLRCYLQSLDLATSPSDISSLEIRSEIEQIINKEIKHRLRKKGFAEDIIFPRGNISRGLDVIAEEGSSESSATSRRHSYLSDKKSDNDDLEDEVFENKPTSAFKVNVFNKNKTRQTVLQPCILVDAKLKEPEVTEARGDWSLKTVEKITGAEVVYLTDSSSSTSSIYDVADEIDNDETSDASIRIITPTIEVTDTEKFLTNTFISKEKEISEGSNTLNNKNELYDVPSLHNQLSQDQNLQKLADESEHPHEIVVLSTEDIKTNLFVKDVNKVEPNIKQDQDVQIHEENNVLEQSSNSTNDVFPKENNTYDLEMKVLKCELNDAINNLIKEVTSDSEIISDTQKDSYSRQDSSSSVCSSQCTAKYNPNYSSLTDMSNIMHDDNNASSNNKHNKEKFEISTSHVKEVFQCVTGSPTESKNSNIKIDPLALRDLCVKKIASFPFGNKILEELAHVSERLQSMSILALQSKGATEFLKEKEIQKPTSEKLSTKMPYFPLPDLSTIEQVSLSTKSQEHGPPPVQPRNSSLRKSQEEQHWTAIATTKEPLYVCLSPSQKMLMEKTNTVIKREDASQLLETHKKFVDRRGYNETCNEKTDTTPIVPFKSQTGSRLLALIRDPSVTNNLSLSSSQKSYFKSVESLPKLNYFDTQEHNVEKSSTTNSIKNFKLFKPIPPPRPRKFSSSFYESDESSDFTDNSFRSMRSEKKVFHYSTGNLNKEIEHDISSIQNMHRYHSNKRDMYNEQEYPRRPSLPKDLCEQQMEYIRRKEKEVEEEIQRLERDKSKLPERKGPRAPLLSVEPQERKELSDLRNSVITKRDILFSDAKNHREDKGKLSSVFSKSQEELLREKMYSEYVCQMAEREQRRQQKFIKISHTRGSKATFDVSKSMPDLDNLDSKVNNRIEKEFISKARERWHKLGIEDPETEDEEMRNDIYREPKVIEHKIKVIQAGKEKDLTKLPSHLQEFVNFTARTKEESRNGESEPEREPAHVVVFCAVIILVLAVGKFVLRLLQYK